MSDEQNQSGGGGLRIDREYDAADSVAAHGPFVKVVGYVLIAHTIGLLSCLAVYQQFVDIEGVRNVMLTSGMIFAIGMLPTIGAYLVFRRVLAVSNEALAIQAAAGDDEDRLDQAGDRNAEAMRQGKNGFKLLSFSVVCFVASTLIGISGLLSL